jgi:hypothetical protein
MRVGGLIALAFVVTLIGCSASTTTVTQAASVTPSPTATVPRSPAAQGCFDQAKILRLLRQWKQTAQDFEHLRTTNREIALELAIATDDDPVVSAAFKHAADVYGMAPAYDPNAPVGSVTPAELSKLFDATAKGAQAMKDGSDALAHSSVPFC